MVGLCWMPHSNQDTRTSIKSYHGAVKQWFFFKTKGLREHQLVSVEANYDCGTILSGSNGHINS
jgi:hypothetical protein